MPTEVRPVFFKKYRKLLALLQKEKPTLIVSTDKKQTFNYAKTQSVTNQMSLTIYNIYTQFIL